MKKTRKVLALVLVFAMLLSIGALAAPNFNNPSIATLWEIRIDLNGNVYLENTETNAVIVEAFRLDENGNKIDVELMEYAKSLNTGSINVPAINSSIQKELPPQICSDSYWYTETNQYIGVGNAVKVTADVVGPATITYGESATITEGFSADISLTGGLKSMIRGGASFNWNTSVSSAALFTVAFDVPAGRTGYVQFRPRLNVTEGTITKQTTVQGVVIRTENYYAWGSSPVKLATGFADGTYTLEYR